MGLRRLVRIGIVAVVAAGSSCSGQGSPRISVEGARAGATTAETASAYMELSNSGDGDDALVEVSCDCAGQVSLHRTETTDGLSMMVRVDRFDVPAGETVSFEPGSAHLMLEDLETDLVVGATLDLQLEFANSDPRTVQARVVDLASLADGVGVGG